MALTIEDMALFCKKKGFIFPNSEIYNGMSGFFDYGPLGIEVKNSIKQSWWKRFVQDREDVVGIDGTIISNPNVWVASGHVGCFADIMVECTKCRNRVRGDQIIEDTLKINADGLKAEDIDKLIEENSIKCPKCRSDFGKSGSFNLMFQTFVGPKQDKESIAYLRPETAQLIFTDFKLVSETSRVKLPFGIAQIGKAFRNEISPRDFLFRTREFEQMEIEFFIHPNEKRCSILKDKMFRFNILTEEDQKKNNPHKEMTVAEMLKANLMSQWHAYWLKETYRWFLDLGIKPENLRLREHLKDELAHYSSACFDIEYKFPFGWKEIHGCADRGDFDLKQHKEHSKSNIEMFDEGTKSKVLPFVIEPSQGVDRALLAFMFDAYDDDKERGNIVLKLSPKISPVKVAVFPLVNKDNLPKLARKICDALKREVIVAYDQSGSVGRRYARNDEIGTPYCITVDFDSLKDKTVTIRDRDSTRQVRAKISSLKTIIPKLLSEKLAFEKAGKLI